MEHSPGSIINIKKKKYVIDNILLLFSTYIVAKFHLPAFVISLVSSFDCLVV